MAGGRQRRRLVTTLVGVGIVAGAIYVSGGVLSGVKTAARAVVSPVSWVVSQVAQPVGHLFAGIINYSDVVAQNQKLQYELGLAQGQLVQNEAALTQLAQITQQLHLPSSAGLPTVMAQVTEDSPTNFSATFTISKGDLDGVLAGMPVEANGGLVGRVVSTTPHSALVRLLTDPQTVLNATFGNGSTDILVSGEGLNSPLASTQVPVTSPISLGQVISTSGLQGGLFPPGIPVAKVSKLLISPGASDYAMDLTPVASFAHLTYVNVLQWEPST
ncbi:MAG: rod shape-determining protein MreC [Acidobacteria bacterium]|nr:rod shape-determining protein MreC [Acidobacteriota bacterium]